MQKNQVIFEEQVGHHIKRIEEFLEMNIKTINPLIKKQVLDFSEFSKYSIETAEALLENPQEILKCIKIAWDNVYHDNPSTLISFCVINLPKTEERKLNKIRNNDIGHLITIKGIITQRSEVYSKANKIKFSCVSCGANINIIQDWEYKDPTICVCGKKTKFKEVSKEMEDIFDLSIEALPESLTNQNETPRVMECYVSGDAIVEDDSKCYPGARVALVGYLETRQKNINKRRSSCYSFKFKVVSYYNLDDYDIDESITPEEQELYNAIQTHPHPHKFLRELLFPHHLGNAAAIEAAIIQQFCGGRTVSGGRDTIHILFCGDTGTGKTEIAKRVIALNPISRFASATELSSVGLIATVERDKINERWVLKAGLLPRCNGGVVCLDEIEKADDRVKAALHTSMECGISTINKASISAKVVSETGILATSNPKVYLNSEKVFQKIGKVGQNHEKVIGNFSEIIDLPVTILDRFDLIFFFEDQINAKKDEKIATLLVERDTFEEEKNTFPKKRYTFPQNQYTFSYNNNTFSYITINKYIWKLKKNQNQKIGFFKKKITLYIFRWYAEIRQASTYLGFVGKTPTPRLVESLLRFARAITRIKNKSNMGIFEIRDALELFNYVYAWDKAPEEYIKDDPTEAQKVTQNTQKVTQNPNNVTG